MYTGYVNFDLLQQYDGLHNPFVMSSVNQYEIKTSYQLQGLNSITINPSLSHYVSHYKKYNAIIRKSKTFFSLNVTNYMRKLSLQKKQFNIITTPSIQNDIEKIKKEYHREEKTLKRSLRSIKEIVDINYVPYTKFITFTFRENITDLEDARSSWRFFMRKFKNTFGFPFKHIKVVEHQKRGAIHFHCIVFIDRKIDFEKIKECWTRFGSVDIKLIKGGAVGVTKYITKYITKSFEHPEEYECFARVYTCSRALKRADVIRCFINGTQDINFSDYSLQFKRYYNIKDQDNNSTNLFGMTAVYVRNRLYKGSVDATDRETYQHLKQLHYYIKDCERVCYIEEDS